MARLLYRGISTAQFIRHASALVPKGAGPFYAPALWDEFQWDGADWDGSERNAVVRHQWQQRGLPTSGISTTPFRPRAEYYATSGGKEPGGRVIVINRDLLAPNGIREFVVETYVPSPAVPEDSEVILVGPDGGILPQTIVVEILDWPPIA